MADKARHSTFLAHWKTTFPWVKYDRAKHAMFCTLCLEAQSKGCKISAKNTFVIGGNTNFQKNALRRHQDGSTKTPTNTEHRRLVASLKLYKTKRKDQSETPLAAAFQKVKQNDATKDREAVLTLFQTVYYLSITEQPLSRYESQIR